MFPGSHIWLLSSYFGVLPSNGEGNNSVCPYGFLARLRMPLRLLRVTLLEVVEDVEALVDNYGVPSAASELITELI